MYGMIFTRPDLAFALGRLSQYMAKPAIHHGHTLKNLMRYVRSTIKQKIRFGPGGAHENKFGIYTDADWASDKSDRKSISGGIGIFMEDPPSIFDVSLRIYSALNAREQNLWRLMGYC
jgi:hypothetical protein